MRSLQYFPLLQKKGLIVTHSPLFNDAYLDNLYNGKRSVWNILNCYWRRLIVLFTTGKYDKIVIEYELFPYLPALAEIALRKLGISYIVDYDDAIFHNYDRSDKPWIRKFLSNKIDVVMKNSTAVVAGNQYLAYRAKQAGAQRVELIPTVIDLGKYKPQNIKKNDIFTIGWLGSPSTFKYIEQIMGLLQNFASENHSLIHIVGAKMKEEHAGSLRFIPWSEASEVNDISKFDVGVMPLEDTPWSRGKCGFKLIQYMACGVPVIASAVGANVEIVSQSNSGILVRSEEEWMDALMHYYQDSAQRQRDGTSGRKAVEEQYSVQRTTDRWYEILTRA